MKSNKNTKLDKAANLASNAKGVEAATSLQSSLVSPNAITVPNNNGQLASFKCPEYDLEKEEKSKASKNGQITNDGGAGDDANPDGNGSNEESGAPSDRKSNEKKSKEKSIFNTELAKNKDKSELGAEKSKESKKKVNEEKVKDEEKIEAGKEKKKEKTKKIFKDKKNKNDKKDANKSLGVNNPKNNILEGGNKSMAQSSTNASIAGTQVDIKTNLPPKVKKKGGDYVIGANGIGAFSESQIINKTPEGNAVVHAENGLSGEQTKQAKPFPQEMIQDKVDQRKASNAAGINSFSTQADAKIAATKSVGASHSSMFGLHQATAISEIDISAQTAIASVDANISSAINEVTTSIDSKIGVIKDKTQTVSDSITEKANAIKVSIEQEVITAIDKYSQMSEEAIGEVEKFIENEAALLQQQGIDKSKAALALGEAAAARERAKPIKEQSTWQNITNGGKFEENKKKARVDACLKVGTETAKDFIEKAEKAVALILKSKSNIRGEFTSGISNVAKSINDQGQNLLGVVDTEKVDLLNAVKRNGEDQCNILSKHKASSIESLNSLGVSKKSEIQKSAGQLKANINSTVVNAKKQFHESLHGSISQLSKVKMKLVEMLSSQVEMPEKKFAKVQSQMTIKFNSANQNIQQSISTMGKESCRSIVDSGSQGSQSIQETSKNVNDAIKVTKDNLIKSAQDQVQNSMETFDQLNASSNKSLDNILVQSKSTFETMLSSLKDGLAVSKQKITSEVKSDADAVRQEFSATLSKLNSVIATKANEAESKVKPRWKALLSIVIEVLAAVALAAVVALLVATGTAIIWVIIGAIVAGAVLGAGRKMIDNSLDGKPLTEGVLKEAAIGGVEGLFAALTGGAGARLASKAGVFLTGTIGSGIRAFCQKSVVKVAIKVLTGVAEDASKAIAGNLMDGKSWNHELIRTISASLINKMVGAGTSNLTGRIGASERLGSQVNEGFTRRAGREGAEFVTDFAGNSIGSGVDGIKTDYDAIQRGDKGYLESFGDGMVNDFQKNSVKSLSRNLGGAVTNDIFDRNAQREINSSSSGMPSLSDGYSYTTSNTGALSIRRTHEFDASGSQLQDLSYDSSTNTITTSP